MGQKLEIKEGDKFGKLRVIVELPRVQLPSGQYNRVVLCACDCGRIKQVRLLHLVRLRTISCGCLMPIHGGSGTKLYNCWRGMLNRATNPKHIDAHRYMGRGIKVCEEWKRFVNFQKWAVANGYKDGLQIDRKDNNKGYYPSNCRFTTGLENVNNREVTFMVTYGGVKQSLKMLLHFQGIDSHYNVIYTRIKRGWSHETAINTPIRQGNYKRKVAGVL